jgi:cytochrome c oxidase assembly factor CtaG/putative copper export protein
MAKTVLLAARGAESRTAVRSSRRAVLVVLVALGLSIVVAVGLLAFSGQLQGGGPFDSSQLVRYGLPVARAVHDLAAALTVGLLVVGTWCLAPDRQARDGELTGLRLSVIRRASIAAAVWLVAALTYLVLTAADLSDIPVGAPGFGGMLVSFVGQIDLGRSLGVSALIILVVITLAISATRIATAAWAATLSLLAVLPIALVGHSATGADHMNGVDSLAIHLVGTCLWVGGLAALLLIAGRLGDQLQIVVPRYSRLAGWCFAAVAASGVINALLRLGSLRELASAYGLLVIGKTAALVLLGLGGLAHRTRTIRQLPDRPRLFLRLAAAEVILMGATIGLAVALSRSAPPASGTQVDSATLLLGFPAPPPLTLERYAFSFYPDILWLTVAGAAAGLYAAGVFRLRRRGDRWPSSRVVSWLSGCGLLVLMTSGGPAIYGKIHFSTHMLQHMILMMGVPLLWVLGAPVTLALRALRPRTDGSLGARETLLQMLHSRPVRLLGNPITAEVLFIASLVIFYYTSIFDLAMFTHVGHVLMTAHFVFVGYLFIWCMIGIDPGAAQPAYPFRVLMLFIMLGVHAFFGVSLMSSGTLLAPNYWHAIGQTNNAALLADQQLGGAIAWGSGDIPSLLLAVALVFAWMRDDQRRARQLDRQAERDNDAELRRYNERLAALTRRDTSL